MKYDIGEGKGKGHPITYDEAQSGEKWYSSTF
jgi:hypothetical protein